jgi:hypothetical protein
MSLMAIVAKTSINSGILEVNTYRFEVG